MSKKPKGYKRFSSKMNMRDDATYEVGYRKPPKSGQFKKGKSGNPTGRPKMDPNGSSPNRGQDWYSLILAEANRKIPILENGEHVELPIISTILRSMFVNAAKGNVRTQSLAIKLLAAMNEKILETDSQFVSSVTRYKRDGEIDAKRRARLGLVPLDWIPHPDDIHLCLETGIIEIRGPLELREVEKWNRLRRAQSVIRDDIEFWHEFAAERGIELSQIEFLIQLNQHLSNFQAIEDRLTTRFEAFEPFTTA